MRRSYGKRSSGKNYLPSFEVQVTEPEFEIHRKKTKAGEVVGQCVFSYKTLDRASGENSGEKEVRLPIVCLWGSPGEDWEAVKAHLKIERTDMQTVLFYYDLLRAKEALTNRQGMTMTASGQQIIRYGRPNNNRYGAHLEDYTERVFYDSKSMAITAILTELKKYRMIGGINTASFSNVPNELLEQVGFLKSPELMGRGIDMWFGTPAIFATEAGDNWGEGKKRFDDLMTSFLQGLQKALQANITIQPVTVEKVSDTTLALS